MEARLLGIPDLGDGDDDVLAGGDITVNRPSNAGPWIFASTLALLVAVALAGGWWFRIHQPPAPTLITPQRPDSDYRIVPGTW